MNYIFFYPRFRGSLRRRVLTAAGGPILLLVFLLAGCGQPFTGEDVRIVFPQPPEAVRERFGQPSWELELSRADTEPPRVFASPADASITVRIPAGPPVAIVCRMVFGGRRDLFYPAGALWPHDAGEGHSLVLSWEKGFAADLLLRLERQGYPVEAFNSGRFFRETVLRGAGNPWALNEQLILTTLAGMSFRADRIKLLPSYPIRLSLPAGTWLPRNPLVPVRRTDEEGECDFSYLVEGYHRYYRLEGGKVDIQVHSAQDVLHTIITEEDL
jgi:hypothetical protein